MYGIILQENKIALIRKTRGAYKGKLNLSGGGIEHNETPLVALKRELIEENLIKDLKHIGMLYKIKNAL